MSEFIDYLCTFEDNAECTNIYRENKSLRDNLKTYFKYIERFQPKILILGEAPGYLGCRKTGIPFTSGYIIDTHSCFKNIKDKLVYCSKDKELTATVFYSYFTPEKFQKVLLWNIFPFHPHEPNNPASNRPPKTSEVKVGLSILKQLIKEYNIERIACLGKKAVEGVTKLSDESKIKFNYIRHPGRGGKSQFIEGMNKLIN